MSPRWQQRGIRGVIKQQQRSQKNWWKGSNGGWENTVKQSIRAGGWAVGRRCKSLFCEAKQPLHSLFYPLFGETLSEEHHNRQKVSYLVWAARLPPGWRRNQNLSSGSYYRLKTTKIPERGITMSFYSQWTKIKLIAKLASPHCSFPALWLSRTSQKNWTLYFLSKSECGGWGGRLEGTAWQTIAWHGRQLYTQSGGRWTYQSCQWLGVTRLAKSHNPESCQERERWKDGQQQQTTATFSGNPVLVVLSGDSGELSKEHQRTKVHSVLVTQLHWGWEEPTIWTGAAEQAGQHRCQGTTTAVVCILSIHLPWVS